MRATNMKKAITMTRLLPVLTLALALLLTATAHAAAPGITGPSFALTAGPAYITQPDGQMIYSWGYGCTTAGTGHVFNPSASNMPGATCNVMQVPGPTLIVTEGVPFDVTLTNGEELEVHNPSDMPDPGRIEEIREPYIRASVITPKEFVGAVMELCQERRGEHSGMHYLSPERVQMNYELPLAEIVLDFFDQLKSRTRGYASLDYELTDMKPADLVKLDVLLAGDTVDALSMVVHREKAYDVGRLLTEKLRKRIPRQQYDVPIQAAIGAHIIARETVKAFRKDVIAKCYGGDITRKRKLLEKQKEGKKRMKQVGRVEVPQEAFLAVLELGED